MRLKKLENEVFLLLYKTIREESLEVNSSSTPDVPAPTLCLASGHQRGWEYPRAGAGAAVEDDAPAKPGVVLAHQLPGDTQEMLSRCNVHFFSFFEVDCEVGSRGGM